MKLDPAFLFIEKNFVRAFAVFEKQKP